MVDVAQVLKVLDSEVVPLHEEDTGHEAVGDEDTDAGEVVVAELAPEGLVEARDAVVGVGGALAVGDAVEEVAIVCALLPHALHLGTARLEVAKVLLAQAGLLVDGDVLAAEGRGPAKFRVFVAVRGVAEGLEDAFGGLAGTAVGRGEEVEGVIWAEELAQAASCLAGLEVALVGELDPVVWYGLVNVAILWRRWSGTGSFAVVDSHTHCCPQTGHA